MSTLLDTGSAGSYDTAGSSAPANTGSADAGQSSASSTTTQSAVQSPFWADWLSTDGKLNKASYDRLPENLKPFRATLEKHETLESFLASQHHANTLIGKKGLQPLPDDAPEPVRNEFMQRLREVNKVPEKPDGYGFKMPEGMDERLWDGEYGKQVAEILHKHAVSPSAAKELLEHNTKYMSEKFTGAQGAEEEAKVEWVKSQKDELQKEFGSGYDGALDSAFKAARALDVDISDESIGNNAKVIKMLVKVSDMIGEDRLLTKAGSKIEKSGSEEMEDFKRSNLWAALSNPTSGEHDKAKREFERIALRKAQER